MCRWRHVRNLYIRCGHAESLPPVEVCVDPPSPAADAPDTLVIEGEVHEYSLQIQPKPPSWLCSPVLQQVVQSITVNHVFLCPAISSRSNILLRSTDSVRLAPAPWAPDAVDSVHFLYPNDHVFVLCLLRCGGAIKVNSIVERNGSVRRRRQYPIILSWIRTSIGGAGLAQQVEWISMALHLITSRSNYPSGIAAGTATNYWCSAPPV
ncbi:hypothetical protein DFH06DRAFT_1118096 [Mycena polygramma]|nr:hypothetical protein DFH06DRAFT_1118096 [Mycena polygramma]